MKVRKNTVYTYEPSLLDLADSKSNLTAGDRVRVIQLPNAPPPNTMGQTHVERLDGTFAGMVSTASLSNPGRR